ncbi:50S ribosomal protein L4 [Candidatus Peregrinibacteria bacterium]|nr:50S ribosomal protein L4 [Candidatus Peregrinibacteria bacterium]
MKATLYNQKGEKKGEIDLVKNIFEIEGKEGLVHEYLMYQQANARMSIAHTQSKADVRGGGRKPWRQKGTGRARQGSIRNPHWKGGGVAFGPKKWENYEKMMPKKMRRTALFTILTSKAKEGKVMALDKFELDKPKTKDFAQLLSKLQIARNVLVVVNKAENTLKKSAANHKNAKVIVSGYMNPADLLKYDNLMFTETALKELEDTYKK